MNTVKLFEGIKVRCDDGVRMYKGFDFFRAYEVRDDLQTDLIRALILAYPGSVNLSDDVKEYSSFYISLITERDLLPVMKWEDVSSYESKDLEAIT